jgi:SAM-dependent methyltransferase
MTSWDRYWQLVHRADPTIQSPVDLFAQRIVEGALGKRWLDAGCGRASLPAWREGDLHRLVASGTVMFGCDLDQSALHERRQPGAVCAATLDHLPFSDGSFDFVSANMVFEHLDNPRPTVSELVRVTRPGGRLLVHTVNSRHYLAWMARLTPHRFHQWVVERIEGRAGKDVYPTRYRANTVARLRGLFEGAGCRLVSGGLIDGIPMHVPYPGAFELAVKVGLMERRLSRLPGFGTLLRPNLLMEFERTAGAGG